MIKQMIQQNQEVTKAKACSSHFKGVWPGHLVPRMCVHSMIQASAPLFFLIKKNRVKDCNQQLFFHDVITRILILLKNISNKDDLVLPYHIENNSKIPCHMDEYIILVLSKQSTLQEATMLFLIHKLKKRPSEL